LARLKIFPCKSGSRPRNLCVCLWLFLLLFRLPARPPLDGTATGEVGESKDIIEFTLYDKY
jgi:hypothetical protein